MINLLFKKQPDKKELDEMFRKGFKDMKKEEKNKSYGHKVKCNNCEKSNDLVIPLGTSVLDYIEERQVCCYYCGCYVNMEVTNNDCNKDT